VSQTAEARSHIVGRRIVTDLFASIISRCPVSFATMLGDIYGWFTEGFDTADLKDAKALLDELNG
jgi:hypothetical protein